MSWREILGAEKREIEPLEQYPQYPQNPTQAGNSEDIEDIALGETKYESHLAPGFTPEETVLIRKRAKAFQSHLDRPGPHLFFVLNGAQIREGYCLTCGERPVAGRLGVRCRICGEAARIALSGEKVREK